MPDRWTVGARAQELGAPKETRASLIYSIYLLRLWMLISDLGRDHNFSCIGQPIINMEEPSDSMHHHRGFAQGRVVSPHPTSAPAGHMYTYGYLGAAEAQHHSQSSALQSSSAAPTAKYAFCHSTTATRLSYNGVSVSQTHWYIVPDECNIPRSYRLVTNPLWCTTF